MTRPQPKYGSEPVEGIMFDPPPRMVNFDDSKQAGKVQTVLGTLAPELLGITLTHEHLLVDITCYWKPPQEATARRLYFSPLTPEVLGYIRHFGATNHENDQLTDISMVIEEIMLFKQYGGQSLVDASNIGLGRDPVGLTRIARVTGLNIIMGASYYVNMSHPEDMDSRTEEQITEKVVLDVTEGVDGTGIKSGVIGEIGCSWPLHHNERKVLRASAKAQRVTGAPILIHPGRHENAPFEIIEVLSEADADLNRVTISHLDRTVFQRSNLKQLAESGCYLEWDLFGKEYSYSKHAPHIDVRNDAKRMDDIAWLISEGYGHKIVVSQDICHQDRLLRHGGHGYFYILAHIVPRMLNRGFSEESVKKILVENPKDILTFVEPKNSSSTSR